MIEITDINSSGSGVGKIDNMAIFVPFTAIGEQVEADIISTEKNYMLGRLKEIIVSSPNRTSPPCPYYGVCGGCTLMHLDYDEQLKCKKNIVQSAIERIGKSDVEVSSIVLGTETMHYRNKASFPVKNGKIGYYKASSHDIVQIDSCPLLKEEINNVLLSIKPYIRKHGKDITHLVVRTTNHQTSVTIVTNKEAISNANELKQVLSHINLSGIHINVNTNPKTILGKHTLTLFGSEYADYEIMDNRFKVSPTAFLQVNDIQAQKLYLHAISLVDLKGKTVIDAYCGIGTITLALARHAKHVIGIEINSKAIESAKFSAKENSITNVEFHTGKCEKLLPSFINDNTNPPVLFVDPPRAGIDKQLIEAICQSPIKEMVYISCNPSTLARDMQKLKSSGFTPKTITPFDLFPNTAHIECVAFLSRN